jgi:hypothetical protein
MTRLLPALSHNHNAALRWASRPRLLMLTELMAMTRQPLRWGQRVRAGMPVGYCSVPIDLSSRVAQVRRRRTTGTLTVPDVLQTASTANYLDVVDRALGHPVLASATKGYYGIFGRSYGRLLGHADEQAAQVPCRPAGYGWLHDYFFNAVSNCFRSSNPSAGWQGAPNCVANTGDYYNCGDQAPYQGIYMLRLTDGGSTISFGSQTTATTAIAIATAAEERT